MSIQRSVPLPECCVCERPTRRDAWERNRGMCSRCRRLTPYVPTPAQEQLGEWQQLAAHRGRDERDRAAARVARRVDELAERRRRRQQ